MYEWRRQSGYDTAMRIAILCIALLSALTVAAQDQPRPIHPPNSIVVAGRVAKPGVYPILTPGELNTVTAAIAQAGGLIQYADHMAFIIRVDDQGVIHRIEVPLWDIVNHKKPDVMLQAGDIVQIPESPRRRIAPQPGAPRQIDSPPPGTPRSA
jgi:hypothetical protein